jgi:hypothetical protein
MDTKQAYEILKKEQNSNSVSDAVFTMFTERKRPRQTLTLLGIEHRMKLEKGVNFPKEDYIPAIKALAEAGFGELDKDPKGQIVGLKNIKTKLKSIGMVLAGQSKEFETFKARPKFVEFKVKGVVPKPKAIAKPFNLSIQVSVNGKIVHIPVPKELSTQDVAELISRFKQ